MRDSLTPKMMLGPMRDIAPMAEVFLAKAYGAGSILLVPGVVNAEVTYDVAWKRSQEKLALLVGEERANDGSELDEQPAPRRANVPQVPAAAAAASDPGRRRAGYRSWSVRRVRS